MDKNRPLNEHGLDVVTGLIADALYDAHAWKGATAYGDLALAVERVEDRLQVRAAA